MDTYLNYLPPKKKSNKKKTKNQKKKNSGFRPRKQSVGLPPNALIRNPSDATPERAEMDQEGFAKEYLRARQQKPYGKITICVVRDTITGSVVSFGPPVDWPEGVAEKVKENTYKYECLEYNNEVVDTDSQPSGAPCPDRCLSLGSSGSSAKFCYAVSYNKGFRNTMEDKHKIIEHYNETVQEFCPTNYPLSPMVYFGLFDGHYGAEAAIHCADNLHIHMAKALGRQAYSRRHQKKKHRQQRIHPLDICSAMREAYGNCDKSWMEVAIKDKNKSGCVVATLILTGNELYVANCGDIGAVLSSLGNPSVLTVKHVPSNMQERTRIFEAGGFLENGRLNRNYSITRAIGDYELLTSNGEEETTEVVTDAFLGHLSDTDSLSQKQVFRKAPGLSFLPHTQKFYLTQEDEFAIIACDGLWDVLQPASAISFARRHLQKHNSVERTSEALVEEALRRETTDNVTAILVGFEKPMEKDGTRRIIAPPPHVSTCEDEKRSESSSPIPQRPTYDFSALAALLGTREDSSTPHKLYVPPHRKRLPDDSSTPLSSSPHDSSTPLTSSPHDSSPSLTSSPHDPSPSLSSVHNSSFSLPSTHVSSPDALSISPPPSLHDSSRHDPSTSYQKPIITPHSSAFILFLITVATALHSSFRSLLAIIASLFINTNHQRPHASSLSSSSSHSHHLRRRREKKEEE